MATTCSVENCDRPRYQRHSLCTGHRSRMWRLGDVMADVPLGQAGNHVGSDRRCQAEGCDRPRYGQQSWCNRHHQLLYRRIHARGHPLAGSRGRVREHRLALFDAIGPGQHPCHWCREVLTWNEDLHVDHLDADRTNVQPGNLVPTCKPCLIGRQNAGSPIDWTPFVSAP